jgi:hypothetical protein
LRQDEPYLQTNQSEHLLEPRHLGVPLGVSKRILEPMVRLAQTVHLSCINISTISKRTKVSIHYSLVTYEYHWVRPKGFLCLRYV